MNKLHLTKRPQEKKNWSKRGKSFIKNLKILRKKEKKVIIKKKNIMKYYKSLRKKEEKLTI